ncbi:sortase [Candidatus Saccharibacteria bacterium]|nr:sortase [Candidatus Saccharibacteria bacterium]
MKNTITAKANAPFSPKNILTNTKVLAVAALVIIASSVLLLNNPLGPKPISIATTPHVSAAQPNKPTISGQPVRFQVPSLKLDLKIVDGYYNKQTGEWSLSRDKVQYATITPKPNNKAGNTFLYGHYRREVFAPLHNIKADAEAIVTTANGHQFHYRLNKVRVVEPTESAGIFDYEGKPILTVQTCTGSFYQDRQLFVFDLVEVN